MHVMRGERCALADVLALGTDDAEDAAIGTLAVFHAIGGDAPCLNALDVDALDRQADHHDDVRIGIGRLRDGDVLVRITGPSTWAVRKALDALRAHIAPCCNP